MGEIEWDERRKAPRGPVEWETPAEQVDPVKAGLIAGGRWLDRRAAGLRDAVPAPIRNVVDKANNALGMGQVPSIDPATVADNEARFKELEKSNPMATFVGGMVPDLMTINPAAMAVSAAMEIGTPQERALRAATAYGGGKLGQWAGGKIADFAGKRAAENAAVRAAAPADDSALAATKKAAIDAGYVFPPDQINPTPLNRVLTGMSGKISTQQGAAIKNEPVTLALAKRELGIPDNVELSRETIGTVRKTAGQAYEQLKSFGKMRADPEYANALNGMTAEYRALVSDFPEMASGKIETLVKTISKPEFNSGSAVELVKRLRSDARANMKAFDDPEKLALGRIQNKAQSALEDLMDRNLTASGNEGFLQVFRNARTMIAKSHTIEDALEESTGKVIAGKIKGKTLTGGLKTIADTAQAFPKSLQNINTPMPGMSPLDFMAGILGGQGGNLTAGMGIPFVRPIVRAGILSKPYQQSLGGGTNKGADLLEMLGNNKELTKKLGGLLGLTALSHIQ